MKLKLKIVFHLLVIISMISQFSCEHSPVLMVDDDMMPVDTMPVDTMVTTMPCDSQIVYFDLQVLPVLISNCAFSGCHDAESAEDGVVLISYETVIETADVEAFNLDDSELYEVLVDDDEEERMPPAPTASLSPDLINLIAKWILQGAEDLACDPDANGCDTENVSFSATIEPLINTHCGGCHTGSSPSSGISLNTHADVKIVADDDSFLGAVSWSTDFVTMPQGGSQLSPCLIDQIDAWITDGALNN